MTAEKEICAIVTTFHPQADVPQNLKLLREQVDGVLVVDNGSSLNELAPLSRMRERQEIGLIENHVNLGVAAALNIGVRWAQLQGFKWVALFDQDSRVLAGFTKAVFECYAAHPAKDHVGLLSGRYVDPIANRVFSPRLGIDGAPHNVITSGCVIPMSTFDVCGLFEENLFIDFVDVEYCMRIRKQGYLIAITEQAVLLHALGVPDEFRILGFGPYWTPNYPGKRLYYRNRNRIWMMTQYLFDDPAWCTRMCIAFGKEMAKVALGEKNKYQKIKWSLNGAFDGILGRMGKTVDL
jgi:rhamnosyltransferase